MKKETKEKILGLGLVGILASAPVAGICLSGAGCSKFEPETGNIYDVNAFYGNPGSIQKAAETKRWEYITWDRTKGYGRNPISCEQLSSFPDKETILFPVFGIKDRNAVSGNMCCIGDAIDNNFYAEYCMLLENASEVQ